MRTERLDFSIIIRMALSLLPLLFGMPSVAVVLCAYNIAMSFVILGPITSAVSSFAALILSSLFSGFLMKGAEGYGLVLGLEAVLCAAGCIYAISKKTGFYTGVWLSSAGFLIPSFMYTYFDSVKSGKSIAEYLISESTALSAENMKNVLAQNNLSADSVTNVFETINSMSVLIVPSVFIISAIVIGYISMWAVCAGLRKFPVAYNVSFASLKMPKTSIFVLLLALVMAIFGNTGFEYVGFNVALVLGAMYFFCGISFIDFYLRRIVKGKVSRIFIQMILFFVSLVAGLVVPFANYFTVCLLIAVIDSFFDFRKISADKTKKETLNETEAEK